ncbi:MAG: hypothetical protein Kow0090_18430 [Myxococcota bacterium]
MKKTVTEVLDRLCEIGARPPASDAERAAANYLAKRFEKLACKVKFQNFLVRPAYYYIFALHFILFLFAIALSRANSGDGFLLGVAIIISYWGDLLARHHYIRDIFPRFPSLNLVAKKEVEEPAKRIILVAHIDSGRSGAIYRPFFANELAKLFKHSLKRHIAPYYYLFITMLCAEAFMLLRWFIPFGFMPLLFDIALGVCSLILLAGVLAMLDIGIRGRPVEGANGNASGVAAMTALFESLVASPPPNCEIWALATGSKMSGMSGMKAFGQKFFDELDPANTYFINFDHIGAGGLRYVTGEGWLTIVPYPYEMAIMADEIKNSDDRFSDVAPYTIRSGTDGIVPARAGYKTITLTCLNENDYPPNYLWETDTREKVNDETVTLAAEFAKKLVERIAEA